MSHLTPLLLMLGTVIAAAGPTWAQDNSSPAPPAASDAESGKEDPVKQEVLDLSKQKWQWMSDRKMDELAALFHDEAVFVHMGGSMTRTQELDAIKSGRIHYKKADIQNASVRIIGETAIVLNRIRLLAVVGGNEVTNPFEVTEVYVKQNGKWMLAALSFTRLLGP